MEQGPVGIQDTLIVVAVLEIGQHILVLDAAGEPIGQGPFQAVAYLNPAFPVVDGYQQQYAVVQVLVPNAPAPEYGQSVFFRGGIPQGRNGQHYDLGLGFLLEGGAIGVDGVSGAGGEYPGPVLHVDTGGGTGRNLGFCQSGQGREDQLAEEQQPEQYFFHGILLSGRVSGLRTSPGEPPGRFGRPGNRTGT